MTAIEIEESVEQDIGDDDWLPTAHLPDDESMQAILRGGRATRALCGAEMLGIDASDTPHVNCERCFEIAAKRGLRFDDS